MTPPFFDKTSSWNFYCRVSLVKLSYWSKFHVNIITSFGVFEHFCKGLTRNLKIGNTTVWFLSCFGLSKNALIILKKGSSTPSGSFTFRTLSQFTLSMPYLNATKWTHLHRFAVDWTSKFHVEISLIFYQSWKANPFEKHDIDST